MTITMFMHAVVGRRFFAILERMGKQYCKTLANPSDKQLMQISHTTLEGMTMTDTSIFVYALMVN